MKVDWTNITLLKNIIKDNFNKSDVLESLGLKMYGGNFNTLTKYINEYNIDITHFIEAVSTKEYKFKRYNNLNEILIEDSPYASTNNLKKLLYNKKLKHRECELCGQNELWQGKKISLILDHINGKRNDNRLENLRIVCPNCNATLDTHCRGSKGLEEKENIKRKKYKTKKCDNTECEKIIRYGNKNCKSCSNEIRRINSKYNRKPGKCLECQCPVRKESIRCIKCYNLNKKEKPSLEQLLNEVSELGYSATGRKHSVSDNAIRKWIKQYQKIN